MLERLTSKSTRAMLVVCVAVTLTSSIVATDSRRTYVLLVEAQGTGETAFSGWYAVNGKRIALENKPTPFRFTCEAGETIEGLFRVMEPNREIVMKVLDYKKSKNKPEAFVIGTAVEFAWAQPGVGPRFLKRNDSVDK